MYWIFSLLAMCWIIPFHAKDQSSLSKPDKGTLTIVFDNLESDKGCIRLALYQSEDTFMKEEKAILHVFKIEAFDRAAGVIPELPYGTYAFAVFHDENNNDELDTNFLGIPKEPYCFSKPAASKWRVPTFGEAMFIVDKQDQKITVRLERWRL